MKNVLIVVAVAAVLLGLLVAHAVHNFDEGEKRMRESGARLNEVRDLYDRNMRARPSGSATP